jgi:RNA polymerase-binding transcription factor DksA
LRDPGSLPILPALCFRPQRRCAPSALPRCRARPPRDAHPKAKKQLNAKDLAEYQNRLTALLGALTGDIDKLEQEALGDRTASLEPNAEGGTDSYFLEFSLELLERDESTVREIIQALERIQAGTYGMCESCGNSILKERLKLVPHARNCIECQRKEEQASL